MRHLLWLLPALLLGCVHVGMANYTHKPLASNSPTIFPVYVDKNFGSADQLAIQQALEQWNYVFNGHAKLVIVSNHFDMEISLIQQCQQQHGFLIMKLDVNNPITQHADYIAQTEHNGNPNGHSLGFTPAIGDHTIYLVRDRLGSEDVYYIIMHEMGHALGARHTDHGLMYAQYSQEEFQCADYSAVIQVANYQHWPIQDLNYCSLDLSTKDHQGLDMTIDIVGR